MFDIEDCVAWIATNATKKIADRFNERLLKEGITRVQWTALFYLGKYGSISQQELGKKMEIKSSTVVRLIDRMEKEGYILRKKSVKDRRVTYLKLTKRGRELREKSIPMGEAFNRDLKRNISEEELDIFKGVLSKMIENS